MMKQITKFWIVPVAVASTFAPSGRADEVTDWNRNLLKAARVANTSPIAITRSAAIFCAAVFDAVKGIERRYNPIHVRRAAPRGERPAGPPLCKQPTPPS
jgi:hypothetical protein